MYFNTTKKGEIIGETPKDIKCIKCNTSFSWELGKSLICSDCKNNLAARIEKDSGRVFDE